MAYQQGGYYGGPPQGHSPQAPYGQQQYPPPQQPYGAPPPGQYPPQQGAYPPQAPYGQQQYPPPQQGYGAPPQGPPPQQGYQQPPYGQPPPQQYGSPAPGGYGAPPPQPYGAPAGQPPYGAPAVQPYGAPPPSQYGAPQQQYPPQQGYAQPQQAYVQPTPPSVGYGPPQNIGWDASADADALRKAMKGFGTDEKALIRVLATKDPLQVNVLRETYHRRHGRHLLSDVESETSGHFEKVLCALIRGPLLQDVILLRQATDGPGTKEKVLNDILLGRSNADLRAIKDLYHKTFHHSLESDIKADLSMKTERHFMMVLQATRNEEAAPVIPQQVDQDVMEIYKATEGKVGTDELLVCQILTQRSDAQIRAIAHTYRQKFQRDLEIVIKKEFHGHMELALLHQLRTGTDKAMRDALLLEDAMAGLGTADNLLINRVVRLHWDRNHMQNVKGAYQHQFHRALTSRIRGETSGDYERALCACLGELP